MTVITRRPDNRLAKLIWKPGGKTIAAALEEAQANLETVRGETLDLLRAKLEAIQTLGGRSQQTPAEADLQTLYALSNDVVEIAGLFGMPELGQAAYSLCALLDGLKTRGTWHWPSVQVHLNGLLVLADRQVAAPEALKAVVEGLSRVSERTLKPLQT
jgi:hypothetical protein